MKINYQLIKFTIAKFFCLKGNGISILVPFYSSPSANQRTLNWNWLYEYWKFHLPGAEIIMGIDEKVNINNQPFSKACAVNYAAKRALGDIFVIADADGYISTDSVLKCAMEIRKARKKKHTLWFIPYRKFFRLNESASKKLLQTNSNNKYHEPETDEILITKDFNGLSGSVHGHRYGALFQIMPREAFKITGGWDERFRGWGGEDVTAMRVMDTLYGPHKTLPSSVSHIWHPFVTVENNQKIISRIWDNQENYKSNGNLSNRYFRALGNVEKIKALVNEWKEIKEK
jgi:glycosyltransferase involved in cell wall biosynthesis